MEPVGAGLRPRPVWGGRWRICRGRPVCRPVGVFWAEVCPGGHIGPPLRDGGGVPKQTEIRAETDLANGAGRSPPPTGGSGSGPAAGRAWGVAGCGHPALREQRRWCVAAGRRGRRPLRKGEQAALTTLARGAERSVCASGWEEGVGIAAEIIPKVSSNAGQSLSHGCAVPAPFTQGSLALRGTGVRAAVPRAWPPPTKFRTEIWGVGQVVGPYGTKRKPAATAGAALSEAESAERGAGQIRFLPDTLRVQHGVQRSEASAKPRPCSR